MLFTNVMSKMDAYSFIRVLLPIFVTQMQMLKVLATLQCLAVITIVFSACAAFAQRDLKRILAYSSINHLSYCLLNIFAVAGSGTNILPGAAEQAGSLSHLATEKAAALNDVFLQM